MLNHWQYSLMYYLYWAYSEHHQESLVLLVWLTQLLIALIEPMQICNSLIVLVKCLEGRHKCGRSSSKARIIGKVNLHTVT